MAKRKTVFDYASDISKFHNQLIDYPDSVDLKKKIAYRIGKWESLLNVRVEVCQNEQRPWTSDMIGYPTLPMQTKKKTGQEQVGDYIGVISDPSGDKYIGLVIERKSIEDLYNTLIIEENRNRFYREIDRFRADDRFDSMIIIVEGSVTDFLVYQPEFKGNEFDYARRFDTKKNGIINDKKLTVLSDLFIADIPVIFCDNPAVSAQFCGRLMRQRIRKGYANILELQ